MPAAFATDTVFINEIHYDNVGTDSDEAIEIAAPVGVDLRDWSMVLYNGADSVRAPYNTRLLREGTVTSCGAYQLVTLYYPGNGIQNGSPDGLALVDATGHVVQFLSYEGTFTALKGPAAGMTSTDIGVSESGSTPVGYSLQLGGTGTRYQDFTWNGPAVNTFGVCNAGQTFTGGDAPPTVLSTTPAHGVLEVAVDAGIRIHFSEAVTVEGNWFAIHCTSSGTHSAAVNGGPQSYTLVPNPPFARGETCTVTVSAAHVHDQDGTPDSMGTDYSWSFSIASDVGACGAPATPIHTLQGSGDTSPLAGKTVTIEGVVIGDFQGSQALNGFFVQAADVDADNDPKTSEGIFVFDRDFGIAVAVGQRVRVTGRVIEFREGGDKLSLTELINLTNVTVCGSGAKVTPTPVLLPFDDNNQPEWYENMLVTLPQTLTVTDNANLARFGEVTVSKGRLFSATQIAAPGTPALTVKAANDRNRLIIDDGQNGVYREPIVYPGPTGLTAFNTLRNGYTLTHATGVLTYAFNRYRLQPTSPPRFVPDNPRPAAPSLPAKGRLRVAGFNLMNYFTTVASGDSGCGPAGDQECRGVARASEFSRQRNKIISAILGLQADIIGLMELENNGYGSGSAIQDLVNGLNAAAPAGNTYAFVNPGIPHLGVQVITVGLIYRTKTVETVGNAAVLNTVSSPPDPDHPGMPLFDDTRHRPVLAQTFRERATGQMLTIAVTHFKSKASPCNDTSDPDQGDGQGNCNKTRTRAARALAAWLATDPTHSGDPDRLIIGDLNAYAREEPISVLKAAGYTNLIEKFSGAQAYSFVFEGEAGCLDQALANASLLPQVTSITERHINADEPRALDYHEDFKDRGLQRPKSPVQLQSLYNPDPYRSSDHDTVVVELLLH
jgi:predicted extracellular nuclease